MRVKWLRRALRDLAAEASYIAQENPEAAAKVYSYLRNSTNRLEHFPESGRPGRVAGTRELLPERYPYLIPYRINGDIIEILRVFHTRRKSPQMC